MEAWLAEHYIHSDLHIPDQMLQNFLDLWVRGQQLTQWLPDFSKGEVATDVDELAPQSLELMQKHYDLSLPLMQACLGPTMKYSMAFWEGGATSLEDAQVAMMDNLCRKAQIEDGQSILDLGCGFGSLAAFILERYPNCEVVGLNLSRIQSQYIRKQQGRRGNPLMNPSFSLIEQDFNFFQSNRQFDRVLSVGFFEHVLDLDKALAKIAALLEPEGLCFLHYIVRQGIAPEPSEIQAASNTFIQRFIFPGSTIHTYQRIMKSTQHLQVKDAWYINGKNYEQTLAAWIQNFQSQRESIRLKTRLDESMLRLWHLYLRACIALFRLKGGQLYGNGQYLLSRSEGNQAEGLLH